MLLNTTFGLVEEVALPVGIAPIAGRDRPVAALERLAGASPPPVPLDAAVMDARRGGDGLDLRLTIPSVTSGLPTPPLLPSGAPQS